MHSERLRAGGGIAALAVLVLAACGPAPSARPSATPYPHPRTPAPTPTPPSDDNVSITASGVGTYQLVTEPVAVLHNESSLHGAEQVVVHFATQTAGGSPDGNVDSLAVNLAPGQTLPVAADCTDGCNAAASVAATLTVGQWVDPGLTVAASPSTYACGSCGASHGQGSVATTLSAATLAAGAAVEVFAACTDASGTIVGGGEEEMVWQGGGSLQVQVPVIVSRTPSACQAGASTGW